MAVIKHAVNPQQDTNPTLQIIGSMTFHHGHELTIPVLVSFRIMKTIWIMPTTITPPVEAELLELLGRALAMLFWLNRDKTTIEFDFNFFTENELIFTGNIMFHLFDSFILVLVILMILALMVTAVKIDNRDINLNTAPYITTTKMPRQKSSMVFISEQISLWSSVLITILSYIPCYRSQITNVTCFISLSKSFNLVNCSSFEYIHHLVNGMLCVLFLYGNNIVSDVDIDHFNIIVQTNISTIFLILNYNHKHIAWNALFIISFFYYRIKFIYTYIQGIPGIIYICDEHPLVSYDFCYCTFHLSYTCLCALNIYWSLLILNKLYAMYLRNTIQELRKKDHV